MDLVKGHSRIPRAVSRKEGEARVRLRVQRSVADLPPQKLAKALGAEFFESSALKAHQVNEVHARTRRPKQQIATNWRVCGSAST